MATKAKLTLSQLLFRRSSNNSSSNAQANHHDANHRKGEISSASSKTVATSSGTVNHIIHPITVGGDLNGTSGHSGSNTKHRRLSGGANVASSRGRHISGDFSHSPITPTQVKAAQMDGQQQKQLNQQQQQQHQTPQQKVQQQLQGILKKPGNGTGNGGSFGGRAHRSSLQRSKSNPNPSNNPLKEVSWSCPTLEKRREVILNYFERIILENKQEQNGQKNTTKPNIPCEPGNGEPIYEEICDYSPNSKITHSTNSPDNSNKTGSLKPKLGPKKVRMNIPQDNHNRNGSNNGQPIYDKVLCRSQSMLESSTSSSSSSFYDIAPSTVASISSSSGSHHSLYENFRPSTYYANSSSSACSSDGDYGIVGGGGGYSSISCNGNTTGNKMMTTRIAGRSHSFHDNYRNSGHYNMQPIATAPLSVDTDQLYAKVCKRKKLRVVNNANDQLHQPNQQQRPLSQQSTTAKSKPGCNDYQDDNQQLCVQVSCGNVVTMIPVMMPASAFSTSCLSLSSSSDNNTDDNLSIATSINTINNRNSSSSNAVTNHNGMFHQEAEKIIPDKNIAYINCRSSSEANLNGDSCAPTTAAARNRNNLSVIHLLAAYDPTKEIEEFIPTTPSFAAAIIDSTESAPKSISVPVRAGFSACGQKNQDKNQESPSFPPTRQQQPIMLTNCSFGYDNDAFQHDEENYADDEDHHNHHKNLLRSSSINKNTSKDIPSAASTSTTTTSSNSSTISSGPDDGCCSSASGTSDTDTDDDQHHAQKYSFASNGNGRGGAVKKNNNRVRRITFQDEVITGTGGCNKKNGTTQEILLLTSSESEDEEELCEHKSLIEMNSPSTITVSEDILDESEGKGGKWMDDEDRGFDSFLEESETSGESKGDSPSFSPDNLRNQRTFAQMTQNVPQEQLKKKAASVLDLINSEISDLHMREMELKKLHSPQPSSNELLQDKDKDEQDNMMMNEGSGEEFEEGSSGEDDFSDSAIEYDGFTTNGSHSSGQVSPSENLNEMITNRDEQNRPQEVEEVNGNEEDAEEEDEVDYKPGPRGEIKVRPLDEQEDKSIKFVPTDETPIEREIRLAREREEEFRRNNHKYLAICPVEPISARQQSSGSLPVIQQRDVSSRPEGKPKLDTASMPLIPTAPSKDLQMELATARFKKEIEESMEREKELIRETKQKKDAVNEEEVSTTEVTSLPVEVEDDNVGGQLTLVAPVAPTPPQEQKISAPPAETQQSQLRKPTLAKLPIAKLPAARFFSPPAFNANKPSRITPVMSPTVSKGSLGFPSPTSSSNGGSVSIGSRPNYTSFEKYILQTSLSYMANKQPSTPTGDTTTIAITSPKIEPGATNKNLQYNKILADPLSIIQKPIVNQESGEEDKQEEEEKPKKRYIPAQDKIQKEIQELAMREKELSHTRAKWKSTLDLPEAMKDTPEEEKEPLRRTTSTTQSSFSLNATSNNLRTNGNSNVNTTSGGNGDDDGVNNNTDAESDLLNLTNVTSEDVRQVTRVKAPARRRHSLLINQWEERIRQQQQQHGKK